MTADIADQYTAGTSEDDFAEADLPEDIAGQDDPVDLGWGFTTDPKTGQKRAKLSPGRPRKQPTAEELAQAPPLPREPDKPPEKPKDHKPQPVGGADEDKVPPMPRGGIISKGVNKLYRRSGKVIRGFEHGDEMGIGQAFIECTRVDTEVPEDERELTVGEAWENLARSNPRIRAFLLKAVAGGDIWDLAMAHAPIAVAVVMKPWIQRLLPLGEIVESLAEEDEDEDEGTAIPGGLTRDDMQQMADLTQEQAQQMARKAAAKMGIKVSEADIKQAAANVTHAAQDGIPPAFRRTQPKKQTRAQRTAAR